MTSTTTLIDLPDGVTLPYREHGDPSGVPMLLLHGYSDSLHSFDRLAPHLPASVRAIALTQRGHGDADRPEGGYTPEQHAADAAAVMDALGIDAAVVVGHSGGGYTAQRFARDHPGRTLGIGLMCAFRRFDEGNPAVSELREIVEALDDPVDAEFVRGFQESCVAEPVPGAFMDRIVAESLKLPARVWKAYLRGLLEAEVPTEAGTIDAPALILWGDRDAFIPRADQEALATAIPGAELVVYEGTGHCPHWERPERTAADLAAFVLRAQRTSNTLTQVAASTF